MKLKILGVIGSLIGLQLCTTWTGIIVSGIIGIVCTVSLLVSDCEDCLD